MTNSHLDSYLTMGEFLDLAILFESESAEFYQSMLRKATADNVLELLKLLEGEERDHERMLRNYKIEDDPNSIMQFSPTLGLSMPEPESDDPGFDEMLSVAIEREICSRKIYEGAADFVTGDFKKFLDGLAVLERQHEDKLKSLSPHR